MMLGTTNIKLKVNNLGGDSVGHCEKKKVRMDMYLPLNTNREIAVGNPKYKISVSGENEI